MITSVKEILTKAKEGGYAVGAFNTMNLEMTRAIIEGAYEMHSPVIVQITEKTMEYGGGRGMFHLVKNDAEFYAPDIPVGIHLDHGHSFEIVQRAVDIGFTSVMYDGSDKEFPDNLLVTKKVADFCHERGVDVQAELGRVPYLGEGDMWRFRWEDYMTDPVQAKRFVDETNVDALAVAIGNAHGFFQERKTPDYERLEKISGTLNVPLVLHGASDWEEGKVGEVIKRGVSCFNIDTAIRLAFLNNLIRSVREKRDVTFDLRKLLGSSREAVKEVVKEKIRAFGSEGKV